VRESVRRSFGEDEEQKEAQIENARANQIGFVRPSLIRASVIGADGKQHHPSPITPSIIHQSSFAEPQTPNQQIKKQQEGRDLYPAFFFSRD
jgi:hypothetical protein